MVKRYPFFSWELRAGQRVVAKDQRATPARQRGSRGTEISFTERGRRSLNEYRRRSTVPVAQGPPEEHPAAAADVPGSATRITAGFNLSSASLDGQRVGTKRLLPSSGTRQEEALE
jgi:hypothetical protein